MKKIIAILLVSLSLIGTLAPTKAQAAATLSKEELAVMTITEIVNEKNISDEDVDKLQKELEKIGISDVSTFTEDGSLIPIPRGFNQWHDLGGGWRARVDKPHTGEGQYHVHVEGKGIKAAEGVNGKKSHKQTMTGQKVPNTVQKKVKALNDFKKGQKEQKKIDEAAKQIKAKKLNLKVTKDIIIAIGIFVAVVGLLVFAASSVAAWGPFLLLI